MNGTSFSHTREMTFTPPSTTRPTSTTIAMPIAHSGTPGMLVVTTDVIAWDCTAAPIPNEATAARSAKAPAPNSAHQGMLPSLRSNARLHAYMAPPNMLPLWSLTRYFTAAKVSEYFVAMPKTPVIHIQKIAPGPPAMMAVPTPTMLPVPMVAESAVQRAPNWLMSPGAFGSLVTESLMPRPSLRWMKPVLNVRNT